GVRRVPRPARRRPRDGDADPRPRRPRRAAGGADPRAVPRAGARLRGRGAGGVSADTRRGVVDAVDRILNRGGDADDVLRAVVSTLVERGGYVWAGISFVEEGTLLPGPATGEPDEARRTAVPVIYRSEPVGELAADGP